jgi:trk system potassium uptake protein TrkA
MYAIVVGCGRAGSEIAARMAAAGDSVVVIDRDKYAFDRLPSHFSGSTVVGRAIDHEVLEAAGVTQADVLVATTYGDNSNITAAQLARLKYGVPRAIARVKDPVRARVFADVFAERGIETICSTDIVANEFADRLANPPEA